MTREKFMQLCERAAEFCDVCSEVTVTLTKCDGDVISLTATNNTMLQTMVKERSGHQLRELH